MSSKIGTTLLIGMVAAGMAFAQQRGVTRTYGSSHGFGNVIFPGTGSAPSFGQQLGATVAGRPYPGGYSGGHGGGRSGRGPVYIPYAYPIYVGGGYGYGYQQPQQPVVVMQAPPQSQAPVIVNNYYPETANPVMKQYKDGELTPSTGMRIFEAPAPVVSPAPQRNTIIDDKATIYIIVYKDESVHPALAYWIKEGTLHYITLQGTHNRVSVDLVDVAGSEKLNQDRKVEFSLADAK